MNESGALMTTWQRATEIVPKRTYSWYKDGGAPFVPTLVQHSGNYWAFIYVGADGSACASHALVDEMPYEKAPVPPWIVRTEYRKPVPGELYLGVLSGSIYPCTDANRVVGPVVVLIIEPNPEAVQS